MAKPWIDKVALSRCRVWDSGLRILGFRLWGFGFGA